MANLRRQTSGNPSPEVYSEAFLQASPDYALILDQELNIRFSNPAFRTRFCGQKMARGTSFLQYLEASSQNTLSELRVPELILPRQVELKTITADSAHSVSIQYHFFPLPAADGKESLIAAIGRDRTEDLALINEVIQLNIELEAKQKELSEANARLEQVAETDQMTQLYNRFYFFQVAQHFWEEAKRYRIPMVIMMIDIDDFKSINDTYGHLFGDFVLQQISNRLRASTRKSDILARFGGEELILLASNTDMATALGLAERLRAAVAEDPYEFGGHSARVTVSIGVSGTEIRDFPNFESLLDSSDQALYESKRSGKNTVRAHRSLQNLSRQQFK